ASAWAPVPTPKADDPVGASGEKTEKPGDRLRNSAVVEWRALFRRIATVRGIEKAGGRIVLPISIRSVTVAPIIVERFWTLRPLRVTPPHLLGLVWRWIKDKKLNHERLKELRANSPLGEILAAGLANSRHGREIMKECIEEAASRVIHELERYLNALGTIAGIAPLLGLLGTVLAMIDIFSAFTGSGMANAPLLA